MRESFGARAMHQLCARQRNQMFDAAVASLGGDIGTTPGIPDWLIGSGAIANRLTQVHRVDIGDLQRLAILGSSQNMLDIGHKRERHVLGTLAIGRVACQQRDYERIKRQHRSGCGGIAAV
jgi:hypothetical protein